MDILFEPRKESNDSASKRGALRFVVFFLGFLQVSFRFPLGFL